MLAGRLPVTVLGGYLGAGKTTLLNRLLSDPDGLKLAVIVNDFGSIDIDASLIARRDGETLSLTNGCVCCSIGDNLALALHDFAARPANRSGGPDHIVIEASGVADPAKIMGYTASHKRLLPDGVVTVADVETVRARADDRYVGDLVRRQLAGADLVVLGKTDLVAPAQACRVADWIAAQTHDVPIVTLPAAGPVASVLLGCASGRSLCLPAEGDGGNDSGHERLFESWSFQCRPPLDEAALRRALDALPPSVLRAKGIVTLAGRPARRFVFQRAGRRWSLEPAGASSSPSLPEPSAIVFIGLAGQFEPALLEHLFAATVSIAMPAGMSDLLREGVRP